jgi:uncharacterized protein YcbX
MTLKIVDIIRYPIKSGQAVHLDQANIETKGVVGDRRFMLAEEDGRFITARKDPILLDVNIESDGHQITLLYKNDIISRGDFSSTERISVTVWSRVTSVQTIRLNNSALDSLFNRKVYLVFNDILAEDLAEKRYDWGPILSDGYPILLSNTASLDALNHASGGVFEMARFRPNLVIDSITPWIEDSWSRFQIGDAIFERRKPCERCVLVTRDPITGLKDSHQEPLRTLHAIHSGPNGEINFGQNISVIQCGKVSLGDAVTLLD